MTGPVASLNTSWFALIGLLWTGYFVLEGFDFGTVLVAPFISRDEIDRRLCINAIGPVWDGNEVWLIVAGGATFAAFPQWYATLFSGFYLALFLILAGLILRGVSFEFRGKEPGIRWRRSWDWSMFVGSLLPAFLWGVAFTNLIHGLPIEADGLYRGGLLGLIHPIAILGGLAGLSLFCLHGATFLTLKTTGELRSRARRSAAALTAPTVLLLAGLVVWLALEGSPTPNPDGLTGALPLALAALGAALVLLAGWGRLHNDDWVAFALMAASIVAVVGAAFTTLFPRVMVSTHAGQSLTIWNAASEHETLLVMTVVAALFTPLVLAYQAWTYYVFRQRLERPAQRRDPGSTPAGAR
ncbi:MAG: cytochrome d ubiquinol oxidase subunit II [Acidimicrobiaceae bacterium]|nr:cytochrome d ubiquinol oxidase subunit II [Acidimicrobiaceae bacterium]